MLELYLETIVELYPIDKAGEMVEVVIIMETEFQTRKWRMVILVSLTESKIEIIEVYQVSDFPKGDDARLPV